MKRIFTLPAMLTLVMALFVTNAMAQPACAWAKRIAANNEEWGQSVATDNLGNVYYTGNFYSASIQIGSTTLQNEPFANFNYGSEVFLAKYDSCGTFKWAKRVGGNAETRVRNVITDATGNVYICGYGRSDTTKFGAVTMLNRAYNDGFVAKYDANGICQWVQRIDGDDQDLAIGMTIDQSGNLYVTGNYGSTYLRCDGDSVWNRNSNNSYDVFILKLNNAGSRVWLRRGGGDSDDYGYGIGVDASGNVYAAGLHSSAYIRFGNDSIAAAGYNDIFITKYDMNGNEQWLRQVGGTDDDRCFSLATDAAGNSYITGFIGFNSNVSFGTYNLNNSMPAYAYYLAKYDASGTAQWVNGGSDYNAYSENHGATVRLDGMGNPYVIGFYNSDSLTVGPITLHNTIVDSFDVFVTKYKPNGYLQWARTFGSQGNEFGLGISPSAHDVFVCGEFIGAPLAIGTTTLTNNANTGDAFIANNIAANSTLAELCLVTSDSTSIDNILYWDKTQYASADSFIIYREVSSGIYRRIGAQPYSALSQFADTARSIGPANGDPNIGTFRYKLQVLDTAGTVSALGPYHNTVYFVDNGGGTFTWNLYAVENMTLTPVSNYCLMRDNLHNGTWIQVGCVSGTQGTLNDPQYALYSATADWRVYANGFSCTPTLRMANGNESQSAIVKSKSNITNNRGIGVKENSIAQLFLFPNPAGNDFVIAGEKELGLITLYNTMGAVVHKQVSNNQSERIDISRLPAGMYSIQVQGRFMKLIKE